MVEKIGEGGMATVWKARQLSLDRIVAIKILASDFSQHDKDVQRFQAEAQAAAKLKHNGIVQVYDASVIDGRYFFVMEYIGGYSVGDWCRRKGQLPEEDVLVISECVGVALKYAWHQAQIIHCDIKPDNVLIDADGTAKVADLGLARTLTAASASSSGDAIFGTPNYISPEQASGLSDLDVRTDIYSLGASMYHLATGKMLFSGERSEDIMEMQVTARDSNPRDLNPDLSTGVCDLMEWMLMKDRDERPQDWNTVLAACDRVKRGKLPGIPLLPTGNGTLKAGKTATRQTRKAHGRRLRIRRPRRSAGEDKSAAPVPAPNQRSAIGIGLVLAVVVGSFVTMSGRDRSPDAFVASTSATLPPPPDTSTTVPPDPAPGRDQSHERARKAFENVRAWAEEHQDALREIERRFDGIRATVAKTDYAERVEAVLTDNANAQRRAVENVMADLEQRTEAHRREGRWERAALMVQNYTGAHAELSADARLARAQEIRVKAEAGRDPVSAADPSATMQGVESKIVAFVRAGQIEQAVGLLRTSAVDERLASHREDLDAGAKLLTAMLELDGTVIKSFARQQGQVVDVQLKAGGKRVEVLEIREGQVWVVQQGAAPSEAFAFDIDDLSTREVLRRLGEDERPEVALRKGIMALKARAYSQAKRYFERVRIFPAAALLADIEAAMQRPGS